MTAVEFDPFSTTFFEDPYEMYRRLRDEAPVYHSETYDFYALSRYDDVCAASKDWATFTSTHGVDLSMLSRHFDEPLESLIMMDPPRHDRLRALVSRVFTPRAVTALEPMVREVILEQLQQVEGRETFDAVAEFTGPFPVEIISRMLGVPTGERQQIREWLDLALHREPGRLDPTEEGTAAMIELGTYMYSLAASKRAEPGHDMLSDLVACEVDDGEGGTTRLNDVEIAGFATLLGGAGAETVTKLLGNAFVLFARNPDQYRKVVDDPSRIPAAVEEILRILPPSQYQGRYSAQDSTWHGETIPAGHPVLLVTGAALRDDTALDRPDDFEIDRPPALALGFGYGIHSCLGAALARLEGRIAIEEMVRRWPELTIDEDGLRRVHMSNVAGYANVPVTVG
ncbi:MAG: cytochrome P450 [Acidimicrobiales bacterium]